MKQDGNAGAYYKVAGELMAFGDEFETAAVFLGKAVELFSTERPEVVAGLIKSTNDLKAFCLTKVTSQAAATATQKGDQKNWENKAVTSSTSASNNDQKSGED